MKQNRSLAVRSSAASWQAHLDRWRRSGLSRAEYCRRHDLSYWSMTYWCKKLAEPGAPEGRMTRRGHAGGAGPVTEGSRALKHPYEPVVEVGVVLRPPLQERAGVRVVVSGTTVVDVDKGFCAETLTRVLAVLEGR